MRDFIDTLGLPESVHLKLDCHRLDGRYWVQRQHEDQSWQTLLVEPFWEAHSRYGRVPTIRYRNPKPGGLVSFTARLRWPVDGPACKRPSSSGWAGQLAVWLGNRPIEGRARVELGYSGMQWGGAEIEVAIRDTTEFGPVPILQTYGLVEDPEEAVELPLATTMRWPRPAREHREHGDPLPGIPGMGVSSLG